MISILMATYNGSKYLQSQIDSIMCQTIQDFELVIVDDCSKDNTWDLLQEIKEKDNRIQIFRNEKNLGFIKNFEHGLSLCHGSYIALCDQDDIWTQNHLEVLLENISDVDLVCGDATLIDQDEKIIAESFLKFKGIDHLPTNRDAFFLFLLHKNIFQGAACLIRREVLTKALPFPSVITFHDWWLALNAATGRGVKQLNISVINYRQHGTNVTDNSKSTFFKLVKKVSNNREECRWKRLFLNAISAENLDENQQQILSSAKKYYNRRCTIKTFANIPYFCKNYKNIYLDGNKKLVFPRFVKEFLLFL